MPLSRVSATALLTAFLIVAIALALFGDFQTRANMASTFDRQGSIQLAQLTFEDLRRLQIVEENALRGYSLTHDSFYTDQYGSAVQEFDAKLASVRQTLQTEGLNDADRVLADYAVIQDGWRRQVAAPLLRRPDRNIAELDMRNKLFTDYESRTVAVLRRDLAAASAEFGGRTQAQLDRSSYTRAFWLLLFGLLAILFNAYRGRLDRQLEEERTTTQTLQRAFKSESVPLPHCDVGTTYRSASIRAAVGGDVFDVFRTTPQRAMLMIADVSGKGIDAAVLTAFIKFTVRGLSLRYEDPGALLAEFNETFERTVRNQDLFVSMLVGMLDTETFAFRYASAGHDPAFVRNGATVRQLDVTGPLLGIMQTDFETRSIALRPGDTLVLATDGLTEARDRKGEMLGSEGAMAAIQNGPPGAQALADALAAHVAARAANRLSDDLAILVVEVRKDAADA
ncbi:MAG TPA: PP2C family protein-serine/threonine phosphatase [Candidatus Tumulicola sp.]|jgi:sigma-B regulation protein RsbU (phosphoserine phosphatase)